MSTVRPQSKHVVVILDHGASVTDTQLQIAKDAAQVILSAIDEHDKVSMTPVTPSTLPTSIGSFLNTPLKTLYVLWYVFFNPPLEMTLRKQSGLLFILVSEEVAADTSSRSLFKTTPTKLGFPDSSVDKESTCNAGDPSSIPGLGRSAGEGIGYPLLYSGLENSMDSIVHGVPESDMTKQLSLSVQFHQTESCTSLMASVKTAN